MRIDLNADVGESFGRWVLGRDGELMPYISSASIACGFHAGDPSVMRTAIRQAAAARVAIGAHPGLPDLAGFGRRAMAVSATEIEDLVLYQLGALAGIAGPEGVHVQHVKPHGALYAMAATDDVIAASIARAVHAFDGTLLVYAPPGSALAAAAGELGLAVVREGFADRAYEPDGSLTPRSRPGAVIDGVEEVASRAVRLVRDAAATAVNGHDVAIDIDSICVHGDTPRAPELARAIREAFARAGITVASPAGGK